MIPHSDLPFEVVAPRPIYVGVGGKCAVRDGQTTVADIDIQYLLAPFDGKQIEFTVAEKKDQP